MQLDIDELYAPALYGFCTGDAFVDVLAFWQLLPKIVKAKVFEVDTMHVAYSMAIMHYEAMGHPLFFNDDPPEGQKNNEEAAKEEGNSKNSRGDYAHGGGGYASPDPLFPPKQALHCSVGYFLSVLEKFEIGKTMEDVVKIFATALDVRNNLVRLDLVLKTQMTSRWIRPPDSPISGITGEHEERTFTHLQYAGKNEELFIMTKFPPSQQFLDKHSDGRMPPESKCLKLEGTVHAVHVMGMFTWYVVHTFWKRLLRLCAQLEVEVSLQSKAPLASQFEEILYRATLLFQREDGIFQEAALVQKLKHVANFLYQKGRFAEACILLTRAIDRCPHVDRNRGLLFCNRGACHLRLGNYHLALEDTTTALTQYPSYWKALHYRSIAHSCLGNLLLAMADLMVLMQCAPVDAARYVQMAINNLQLCSHLGEGCMPMQRFFNISKRRARDNNKPSEIMNMCIPTSTMTMLQMVRPKQVELSAVHVPVDVNGTITDTAAFLGHKALIRTSCEDAVQLMCNPQIGHCFQPIALIPKSKEHGTPGSLQIKNAKVRSLAEISSQPNFVTKVSERKGDWVGGHLTGMNVEIEEAKKAESEQQRVALLDLAEEEERQAKELKEKKRREQREVKEKEKKKQDAVAKEQKEKEQHKQKEEQRKAEEKKKQELAKQKAQKDAAAKAAAMEREILLQKQAEEQAREAEEKAKKQAEIQAKKEAAAQRKDVEEKEKALREQMIEEERKLQQKMSKEKHETEKRQKQQLQKQQQNQKGGKEKQENSVDADRAKREKILAELQKLRDAEEAAKRELEEKQKQLEREAGRRREAEAQLLAALRGEENGTSTVQQQFGGAQESTFHGQKGSLHKREELPPYGKPGSFPPPAGTVIPTYDAYGEPGSKPPPPGSAVPTTLSKPPPQFNVNLIPASGPYAPPPGTVIPVYDQYGEPGSKPPPPGSVIPTSVKGAADIKTATSHHNANEAGIKPKTVDPTLLVPKPRSIQKKSGNDGGGGEPATTVTLPKPRSKRSNAADSEPTTSAAVENSEHEATKLNHENSPATGLSLEAVEGAILAKNRNNSNSKANSSTQQTATNVPSSNNPPSSSASGKLDLKAVWESASQKQQQVAQSPNNSTGSGSGSPPSTSTPGAVIWPAENSNNSPIKSWLQHNASKKAPTSASMMDQQPMPTAMHNALPAAPPCAIDDVDTAAPPQPTFGVPSGKTTAAPSTTASATLLAVPRSKREETEKKYSPVKQEPPNPFESSMAALVKPSPSPEPQPVSQILNQSDFLFGSQQQQPLLMPGFLLSELGGTTGGSSSMWSSTPAAPNSQQSTESAKTVASRPQQESVSAKQNSYDPFNGLDGWR